MGSRYGDTLGELIARKSRGEDVEIPDPRMVPLNRADARSLMREEAPRSVRKQQFGRSASRRRKNFK